MQPKTIYIAITALILNISSCSENKTPRYTPWGDTIDESQSTDDNTFSISDIQSGGELIMLTISGPDTYFDYHGRGMGTQYLLCEKFAQRLGVSLRVELCKTTQEMIERLKNGEGDIIASQVNSAPGILQCGYKNEQENTAWAVSKRNTELADSLNKWYTPKLLSETKKEENFLLSSQSIHRRVYAPMLNANNGTISQYDHLFMRYAAIARWDWRLMAAQCYQESCFDNKAYSWAGARGLMQIMPATAKHLGLPEEQITDPEQNIHAAARLIAELSRHFEDIRNPHERQLFVLASYNGGYFHIRDAMRLAEKDGKDKHRWDDVAQYVLRLQSKEYYSDPVVKYGYMRGSETVEYVSRIKNRWNQYRGKARAHGNISGYESSTIDDAPRKATKKHRFKL